LTWTAFASRRLSVVVALVAVAAVLLVGPPITPAFADPDPGNGSSDIDGPAPTNPTNLRDLLDIAAAAYNDAKARLETSQQRQAQIVENTKITETQLAQLTEEIGPVSAAAYRGSRLSTFSAMLNSESPDAFLRAATTVDYLARHDDKLLRELNETKKRLADQKRQLEDEIKLQQQQLAEMEKRKNDASKALASYGGGAAGGFVAGSPSAKPAPRNPDGSFPKESCSVKDPTTTGCLTPRTLHALQEARIFGFTRYTACFRHQSWGEHPRGRACDFSAETNGFGGIAVGGDKLYGDRLAGWLMANASRLGVLYVIWYRQIWFPGLGWRVYHSGSDPASSHRNHVHLSIQ
jgi:peptidoglycan DL-endopeptidase CwlO